MHPVTGRAHASHGRGDCCDDTVRKRRLPGEPGADKSVATPPVDYVGVQKAPAIGPDTQAFFIGDVHAGVEKLNKMLHKKGIVNPNGPLPKFKMSPKGELVWDPKTPLTEFLGGATLTFLGDLCDKDEQSIATLSYVQELMRLAPQFGSEVSSVMGNHEHGILTSAFAKEHQQFYAELTACQIELDSILHGDHPLGRLLRGLPMAHSFGDGEVVVAHAGNTGGRTLEELGAEFDLIKGPQGYLAQVVNNPDSILEARGAYWGEGATDPRDAHAKLRALLSNLGATFLIQGHQPGHIRFPDGSERKRGEVMGYGIADDNGQMRYLVFTDSGLNTGGVGTIVRAVRKKDGRLSLQYTTAHTGKDDWKEVRLHIEKPADVEQAFAAYARAQAKVVAAHSD